MEFLKRGRQRFEARPFQSVTTHYTPAMIGE